MIKRDCCFVLASTAGMTPEEFSALRKKHNYIGGSDAAAIIGMNPFSSKLAVYCDKMGMAEDPEDLEPLRIGRELEDYVARRFAEETGKKVARDNHMYRSIPYPFASANIDRRIVGEYAGLECKTTRLHYDFEGGQIPDWYYVQSVHYMAVRGYERYYIAVLDMSRMKFHWFKIERNEDEIKKLMDAERDFWEGHILPGIPPEADGSETDNKALASLFRKSKDNADDPVLLHDMDDAMDEYIALGIRIKALQMEQDKIKQDIQLRLGENAYGGSGRFSVSWKASTSSRIDAKKLRERYPRVAEECSYESVSRRFNLASK